MTTDILTKPNDSYGPDPDSAAKAIAQVAADDVEGLIQAREEYGDSWCDRGGSGAWFTIVRPLDRLNKMMTRRPAPGSDTTDIFAHMAVCQTGDEGVLNAVRDLRRYLLLAEAELVRRGHKLPLQRHNIQARAKMQEGDD